MLSAIWALFMMWQVGEHLNVRKAARNALIEDARLTSGTCGKVLSGFRFSVIPTEVLQNMLKSVVEKEVRAVVLLNASGEKIVAVSEDGVGDVPTKEDLRAGPHWEDSSVWIPNIVDLGTNTQYAVLPRSQLREMRNRNRTNAEPQGTNGAFPFPGTNAFDTNRARLGDNGPPPGPGPGPGRDREGGPPPGPPPEGPPPDDRRPPNMTNFFTRPPWVSKEEYDALMQKKGIHSFLLNLSTQSVRDAEAHDLWLRLVIGVLGTVAVVGYGLAWQSLVKTSDLQVRLVRASELNLHLKEMNLAAAGLAHETRNPLNIIRGVAQLISKQADASTEVRAKCRDIIDETDRVTGQLNEFINYSRPREVRRAPTDLNAIAAEVARTLTNDLDEKKLTLQTVIEPIFIEADEQLLRQALFNLVINAVQAVQNGGEIRIRGARRNNEEAFIEVSDNGPGVPAVQRDEVFKPYFTTHSEGTGLGLAIVQQIVLAHGWEIACLANEPAGALFRISHVKLCGKN